jgi:DNA-binding transcriptional regulator YiaG
MTPAEIKVIRQRYGLSQSELAALLRISDIRTIRRWEAGEVPVSGPASIVLELMDADELHNRFWP